MIVEQQGYAWSGDKETEQFHGFMIGVSPFADDIRTGGKVFELVQYNQGEPHGTLMVL